MTITVSILSAVCAIMAIAFMAIRVTKAPIYGLLAKTVASLGFVIMGGIAVFIGSTSGMRMGAPLFAIGLACGLVGDIMLDLKRAHSEFEGLYLSSGMVSFSIGHFFYLAGLCIMAYPVLQATHLQMWLPIVVSLAIAVVVTPIVIVVSIKFMKANFGAHLGITTFYTLVLIYLTIMSVWFAIYNIMFLLLALGMVFFLLSDLVLSTLYFVEGKKEDKLLVVLNHTAYYAAQILIAAFIFSTLL